MPNFFYFDQLNQKHGPVSAQQLKELAAQGVVNPNTPMETDTGHKGKAGQIKDLFPTAPPPITQPVPPQVSAPVATQPYDTSMANSKVASPTGGGKAIGSLVCGIGSLVLCGGFLVMPIIGFILGILGLKSPRRGMAITGICLNSVAFIVALMFAIAFSLSVFQAKGDAAKRTQCGNHQKQIVLALHDYHDAHDGFPPFHTVDVAGKPLHSWRVLILPYLGEQDLYDQIRLDEPWDSPHNAQFHNQMPSVYQCPSNPGAGCSYSGLAGEAFIPASRAGDKIGRTLRDLRSGASETLAILEVKEPFNWMDPTADMTLEEFLKGINTPDSRAGSHHLGGMNASMFDGTVEFFDRL